MPRIQPQRFLFRFFRNCALYPANPTQQRGVRVVTNARRDAMGGCIARRAMPTRTAKSCGSGAPRLALSRWSNPRRRRQQRLVSGKSAKQAVKTIARGRPGNPVEPVVTDSYPSFYRMRGYGCGQRPAFPAPSVLRRTCVDARLGQFVPRECVRMSFGCLKFE